MGTITITLQQCRVTYLSKPIMLDKLTQPGWQDAADYCCGRDKKHSKVEVRVPAVTQLPTDDDAVASAPTTFVEPMEYLDIVPRILQMPKGLLDQKVVI